MAADPIDHAEVLAAGFRPRTWAANEPWGQVPISSQAPVPVDPDPRPGAGFEAGGALDTGPPDGSLAELTDAASRDGALAGLTDDELVGVLRAWRRLESWCCAGGLAAVAELARRRPAERTEAAPFGSFPAQLSEFITDEVAAALTLSGRSADAHLELSLDLARRLPGTARALHTGVIDFPKARLIAELTRVLTPDHAAEVEARILPAAGSQTTGQLRAALGRAVLAVDPDAAVKRREEALKDPRVRRWQEDAGTAALAGYGLPPADVLQADQRITDRALALRDAGLPGTLEELRARAYLDTLLGQSSIPTGNSAGSADPTPQMPDDPTPQAPDGPRSQARDAPAPRAPQAPDAFAARPRDAPASPAPDGLAPNRRQRRLAARVTLTVPLLTQLGLSGEPGSVAGFGPIDPALCRELTSLSAADPASRFCVTVTGPDGQAVGHGCLPGRRPDRGLIRDRPPDTGPPRAPGFTVVVSPLARDDCDHRHQEAAYQPSRKLRHLIYARNTTCSAPGCQRPAAQCDLDHTVPFGQGGRTCECDLAPLCRHHHRCKQAEGWRLDQPSPGMLLWTTPAGRRYRTGPDAQSARPGPHPSGPAP
ncbi:MAG TPA: DUF222 domain-containing protein [Streptosporangiaceae bacterium]|nr:DUF222 domain-containing protein [Streptosporangiaceae bacterium]